MIYILCTDFFIKVFESLFILFSELCLLAPFRVLIFLKKKKFQIELFSKSFNFLSNLTRYFTALLKVNPLLKQILTVIMEQICGEQSTSKTKFLLRTVECRIAESLFVSPNQISPNGFKIRTELIFIYFSFRFFKSGFVLCICISISWLSFQWIGIFFSSSLSGLLFSNFCSALSSSFAAIYQFTKWKRMYRSSHQRCSIKKGVLRNLVKFRGKHLCQRLFFPVNFAKFLRTSF